MLSKPDHTVKRAAAFIAAGLVAVCLLSSAETKGAPPQTKTSRKKSASSTKASAHSSARNSSAKSSSRKAKGKRRYGRTSRQRLAALHLEPQRVTEIQQALIREGALNGAPTGTWDEATRDAMRRYQTDHGFAATGLPDAKSLMKLGLGPHPLPGDLESTATAQPSPGTTAKPNPN